MLPEGREGRRSGPRAEAVVEKVVVVSRGGAQEDFGGESATQPKRHGVSDSGTPCVVALAAPGWTRRAEEAGECQVGSLNGDRVRARRHGST